jgi:hypothetical protein
VHVVFGVGSKPPVLLEGLLGGVAAHDDERDLFQCRVALELVTDREAVHARQFDGEQDEVRLVDGGGLQPDGSVVDDRYGAAPGLELPFQLAGEFRVAFEDQYVRHWANARSAAGPARGRKMAQGSVTLR